MIHYLNIKQELLKPLINETKTFEIRKADRFYQAGDTLIFFKKGYWRDSTVEAFNSFSGESFLAKEESRKKLFLEDESQCYKFKVLSVFFADDYVKEGNVILSIRKI